MWPQVWFTGPLKNPLKTAGVLPLSFASLHCIMSPTPSRRTGQPTDPGEDLTEVVPAVDTVDPASRTGASDVGPQASLTSGALERPKALSDFRVVVQSGDGLVVRLAGALALLAKPRAEAREAAERILSIVAEAGEDPAPGRSLARRLAAFLTSMEPETVPSFATLALTGEGIGLLLHGNADAAIQSAKGEAGSQSEQAAQAGQHHKVEYLTGREAASWVDRIFSWDVVRVALSVPSAVPPGEASGDDLFAPHVDLRLGTVRAGGIEVVRRDVVLPAFRTLSSSLVGEEPEAGLPSSWTTTVLAVGDAVAPSLSASASVLLHVPPPSPEDLVTLPASRSPGTSPTSAPSSIGEPLGRGLSGAAGLSEVPDQEGSHQMAHTRSSYVPTCIAVLDDGTVYELDSDYVIGRDPEEDGSVRSGRARPLLVEDPNGTVSRVHAELRVRDGEISIVDRDSSNGTWIMRPGESWFKLDPGVVTSVPVGTQISVGARALTLRERPSLVIE